MTQAEVRRVLGDSYEYRILNDFLIPEKMGKAEQKLKIRYKKITDIWDDDINSEWIIRNYLAIKMIMSASLMLNSLEYSKIRNLQIVEPYLEYYSLLTISRGLLFTTPEVAWNSGQIMKMTHSHIINSTYNAIVAINNELSKKYIHYIKTLQNSRELFSYKFPANGIKNNIEIKNNRFEELVKMCTIIAEISQLQSVQLEFCLGKILERKIFQVNHDILKNGYQYAGRKNIFIDSEDWYRIDYFVRKQPYPINLYFMLSEGMVEDFFGAWYYYDENGNEDEEDFVFNPDNDRSIIFNMP